MPSSTAPIFAAEALITKECGVLIKTEPEYEPFGIEDQIKPETLLYVDHEIKDEMVIGPTEVNRPASGSQENYYLCATSKEINVNGRLFSSKIQLKDITSELRCGLCGKWCLTSAELKCHKKTHTLDKNTTIKYHDSTTVHKQKHTLLSKEPSMDKSTVETTKLAHLPPSKMLYACDKCKKIFVVKHELEYHIAVKHNDNSGLFTCNTCDDRFKNSRKFSQHIIHHYKESCHSCQKCKKLYKREHNYLQHLSNNCGTIRYKKVSKIKINTLQTKKNGDGSRDKIEQNNKPTFICDICDKKFAWKGNLERHQKLLHSENNQILSCVICDKKFTTKRYLDLHIQQTHNEKRQYWCDICKKGYGKRINLDCHLCAVHKSGKAIKELLNPCKVCNKDLSKPSFWKHKVIHRGECLNNIALTDTILNDKSIFVCNNCQKIFYKKSCLNAHKALRDCTASGNVIDKSNTAGYYSSGRKLRGRSKLIRLGAEKKHICDICDCYVLN